MTLRLSSTRLRVYALLSVGGIVIVTIVIWMVATRTVDTYIVTSDTVTEDVKRPDERRPTSDTFSWRGKVDEPKYIEVQSIGVAGFVQQVGVTTDDQMATPSNIHVAGWFNKSARPGAPGLSILAGHVNGRQSKDGIFRNLDRAKEGAAVVVTLGNGSKKTYTVRAIETLDTADAANVLYSQRPDAKSQINLVTCSGSYDTVSQSYRKRTIVSAVLE